MNSVILISVAVLACMCISSDAFKISRQNPLQEVIRASRQGRAKPPTIIIIRQDPVKTAAPVAPVAPVAPATPAVPATTAAQTGDIARTTSGTYQPTSGTHQSGLNSFTHNLLLADLFDTPYIPHGINPSSYFLLNGGNDFPFLPFLGGAGKSHGASAQPGLQSLLLAQSLDMPFPFMF